MNTDLTHKLLKYLAHGIIIYLLFKFVPKQPMEDHDILLMTAIIILLYAVIENVVNLYWTTDNTQLLTPSQCNTKCGLPSSSSAENKEHMDVVSLTKSIINGPNNEHPPSTVVPPNSQPVQQLSPVSAPNSMTANGQGGYKMDMPVNPQVTSVGSRAQDGELNNEMGYTDYADNTNGGYVDYNNFPQYDLASAEFEPGFSYLPPSQWYPVPPHPPVCVSEKRCPVCPVFTTGLPADLKEWNSSRRVMPPDQINTKYIEEKLNSGR